MKAFFKKYSTALMIFIAVVFFILMVAFTISNQIKKKIKSSQIASFRLHSEQVITNLFLNKISLINVELIDSLDAGTIYIPKVEMVGLSIFSIIFKGEIKLQEVQLQEPKIRLSKKDFPKGQSDKNGSSKKDIHINRLKVNKADVLICKTDIHQMDSLFSTSFSIEIHDLTTSNDERNYSFKETGFQKLEFFLQKGEWFFSDDLYKLRYDSVSYNSNNKKFEFRKANIQTNFSKYGAGKQTGVETDWFDIGISGFAMQGIQLSELLNRSSLVLDDARIDYLSVNAFRDKRLPFPQKPDTKLPMEMLDNLPLTIQCDLLKIADGDIRYEERVEGSEQAGVMTFNSLNVEIKNLVTVDSLEENQMTMDASARVMDQAVLNANFKFPTIGSSELYQASGKLGAMPITAFNPLLKQNAAINVEKGDLKQIAFNFFYNNQQSNGDLLFEYEDLKISIIDKDDRSEKKIKSFLVNSFVLGKENLTSKKSFNKGTIKFERDKKKSIFNYWWKSVLSGIKSTVVD